jgi:hypothetical protein
MRRRAQRWLIRLNVAGVGLSTTVFVISAALTTIWIPNALTYTSAGLVAGMLLGVLGLALTRWEPADGALYYTPNRWLVLMITLAVAARLAYGFWRSVRAWESATGDVAWTLSDGLAGSLGAGALILGYYLAFWIGVARHAR